MVCARPSTVTALSKTNETMRPAITLYFVLFIGSLWASNGNRIEGKVLDGATHSPLAGATVFLEGAHLQTITNQLGLFQFDRLSPGIYRLSVRYLGYALKSEELVVTESETPTQVVVPLESVGIELPAVEVSPSNDGRLQTLGAIDLHARPVQSAQDLLELVPGLFIAQHAGGGKAEQIFLRGFDLDHGTDIAISVDGMPVNMVSHAHGQGYADLHFLIPETLERIDFQKGGYQSEVGNLSTAGSVDFHTKQALDQSLVKLEAGQFNTFRGLAMIDLLPASGRHRAYAAAEGLFTDGYFESPQDFHRINLFGKYRALLSERQSLESSLSYFQSRWNASGQIPYRAVTGGAIGRFGAIDDTEGGETSRANLQLRFLQQLNNGWLWTNQGYYTHYEFELYSNFTFFANDPINGDQIRQRERRESFGYHSSLQSDYRLGTLAASSRSGLQLRYDRIDELELSHTKDRRITLDPLALGAVRELNLAGYVDQDLQLTSRLHFSGGLRFDLFRFQYDDELEQLPGKAVTKGIASPKLSLAYRLSPKTSLYLRSGMSFHSNDSRVVVAQKGEQVLPRSYGADLGIQSKLTPRLLIDLAAWWLRLEQEFVYVGDEAVVEPSGRSARSGFDLSARWQLWEWLFIDSDLHFSFGRAVDEPEGENHLPLAPAWTGSGGLRVETAGGWGGSLRYRLLADRPANEDYSLTAEGYFLLDLLVNYRRGPWEAALTVQNLLDRSWEEAQFATTSRLFDEPEAIEEIHFTPGHPFFLKAGLSYTF